MLFFWNRFELPAVANGLVSEGNPRAGDMFAAILQGGGAARRGRGGVGLDIDSAARFETDTAARAWRPPQSPPTPPPPPPTANQTFRRHPAHDRNYDILGSPHGGDSDSGIRSAAVDDYFTVGEGITLDERIAAPIAASDTINANNLNNSEQAEPPLGLQTELSVPLLGSYAFSMMGGRRTGTPVNTPASSILAPSAE